MLVKALAAAMGVVVGLTGAVFLAAGFNFGYPVHWCWLTLGVIFASVTAWVFSLTVSGIRRRWLIAIGLSVGWVAISLTAIVIDVHLYTHSVAEATATERPLLNRIAPFPGATPLGYETDPRGGDSDWREGFLNQPDWYMLTRSERLPRATTRNAAASYYVKAFERAGYKHPGVKWTKPEKGVPPDPVAGELPFVYISPDLDTLQPLCVVITRVDGRLVAEVAADTEGNG
jgi:hypothetical protein